MKALDSFFIRDGYIKEAAFKCLNFCKTFGGNKTLIFFT